MPLREFFLHGYRTAGMKAGERPADAVNVQQLDDAAGRPFMSATVLAPETGDNVVLFRAPYALTVTGIAGLVGLPGTEVIVEFRKTAAPYDSQDITPFYVLYVNDANAGNVHPVDADVVEGEWVWMVLATVTGAPPRVAVTLRYDRTPT